MTNNAPDTDYELATFGGGCFWCVEIMFQDLKGVLEVESGYAGGHTDQPVYKEICSGLTGHAEVVQITFDPSRISYATLLDVFFSVHDPTTLNRQGNDVGTQYRSVVFFHSEAQKLAAEKAKLAAQSLWGAPVVTEISMLERFFPAESYHQNYYKDNPYQPYCSIVIAPKVRKFREKFSGLIESK